MDSNFKRQKGAYIAGLVEREHLTCEKALQVTEETFGASSISSSGARVYLHATSLLGSKY